MSKSLKHFLYVIGGLLLVFLIGYGIGKYFIRFKIDTAITDALPSGYSLEFEDSSFNLWTASYSLDHPKLRVGDSTDTTQPVLQLHATSLALKGMHYWDYLMQDTIRINRLQLKQPELIYVLDRSFPTAEQSSNSRKNALHVKNVSIDNGTITVQTPNDSTKTFLGNISVSVNGIEPIQKGVPAYKQLSASSDTIDVRLNAFDRLRLDSIGIQNNRVTIKGIQLATEVSRTQLSQQSPREKDHYTISIPLARLEGFDPKNAQDKWGIFANMLHISQPNIDIYRDKRLPDDTRYKPMFGEMLRKLSIPMAIDSVAVRDLKLIYQEKISSERPPGEVTFTNFQADITHVGNTYADSTQTTIDVTSDLFENTPIEALWTFRVQDTTGQFRFECEAGSFQARVMNSFTIPSSRMSLEGDIIKTYFTITGDNDRAHINLKTRFNDLRVKMLEEDERDGKEITNLFANAIVNKESSDEEDNFKEGQATTARKKNKSAFNYIWINIMSGLKQAVLDHNDDDD